MNTFWVLFLASIFTYVCCTGEEVSQAEDCLILMKESLTDPSFQTHLKQISEKEHKQKEVKREEYLKELEPLITKLQPKADICMDQKLFNGYTKNIKVQLFNSSVIALYNEIYELNLSLKNDKICFECTLPFGQKIENDPVYKQQVSLMKKIERFIRVSILPKSDMFPVEDVKKNSFLSHIFGRNKKQDQDKKNNMYF